MLSESIGNALIPCVRRLASDPLQEVERREVVSKLQAVLAHGYVSKDFGFFFEDSAQKE